jgi:ribonuclease HI
MEEVVNIYTDGACRPSNPGPGGCACIMLYKEHRKEITMAFKESTNSRMELMAVILALESMKKKNVPIRIHADANYIVNSVKKGWLFNWEKENFYGRLNSDLWKRFLKIYRTFTSTIDFIWVKGHSGVLENENCDKLANKAATSNSNNIDVGYNKK